MLKQNWFPTLNEALESEGLLDSWDCFWPSIGYGETRAYDFDDGTKYGRRVSVYRNTNGYYERPVTYQR